MKATVLFLFIIFLVPKVAFSNCPLGLKRLKLESQLVHPSYFQKMQEGYPPEIAAGARDLIAASPQARAALMTSPHNKRLRLFLVIDTAIPTPFGRASDTQLKYWISQLGHSLQMHGSNAGYFGITHGVIEVTGSTSDLVHFLNSRFAQGRVRYFGLTRASADHIARLIQQFAP